MVSEFCNDGQLIAVKPLLEILGFVGTKFSYLKQGLNKMLDNRVDRACGNL